MIKEEIYLKSKNIIKIFYRLFFLASLFFSVFVLLQLGDDFTAVGIAGIVVLIAGYLFFSHNEKEKQEERERDRMELDRKLDELLNAQRAIYTITKRSAVKLEQEFTAGGGNLQIKELLEKTISLQERALSENRKLAEIQVNALKTVAKYNKENTRQLALNMNQNIDRLVQKLQSSTAELQHDIHETTEAIEEVEEFYQSMSANIASALEKQEDMPETGDEASVNDGAEIAAEPETDMETEKAGEPEQYIEMDATDEPIQESVPESGQEIAAEPETVQEATKPQPKKEELPLPVMDDPNKKMTPDEIAALFASMGAANQPASEPVPDPISASAPDSIVIPDPDPIQTPSLPEMDDPNKKMDPDDIAALIAALNPQE